MGRTKFSDSVRRSRPAPGPRSGSPQGVQRLLRRCASTSYVTPKLSARPNSRGDSK